MSFELEPYLSLGHEAPPTFHLQPPSTMTIPEEIAPAAKAPPEWKVCTRKLRTLRRLFRSCSIPIRRRPPTSVTNPAPFPFLRLPRELRDQIYRELLIVDNNNNNNNEDGDNAGGTRRPTVRRAGGRAALDRA
ncbi:uncharacterized protein BO72DRAFT_68419 [Aspergillus fijiensis CBS 313.89]|uniref:Uncharacterized protein n=1 Tax=Aspergillus fijiensis CBS 313.89 TaxID=1448319 RepID=A0A8G1RVQ9_9EURO|nr:uncharacterized protein BO72DRAFT_68419 [Aspergillus fijiensis CBS 313.89]RAK78700.1 hypothetical protein BO72DRAFT_68419 [Aspergillus fijiensis CBS 313.89]